MVSRSILPVEDGAAIREMVQHALSRAGFETRAVAPIERERQAVG